MSVGKRMNKDHPRVQYEKLVDEDQCMVYMGDNPGSSPRRDNSNVGCLWHCVKKLVKIIDFVVSNILRINIYLYWIIAGRTPRFLDNYYPERNELLTIEKQELERRTRNENEILTENLKQKLDEMHELEKENASLRDSERKLESEKQDALTRLSELVSVKLRDNNPNIVDLNDQCRPTKLAEKFSELYDNEWTSAFTILEETFKEQHAIVILLDIVMEAYGFCEQQVAVPWNVLTDWFLDMSLPGAQQTAKWLKDSRKAKIRDKVLTTGKDYGQMLLERCKENKLAEFLLEEEMQQYITKCVELCLLMVATDPPVVLSCPGWTKDGPDQISSNIQGMFAEVTQREKAHNEDNEGKDEREVCQSTTGRKNFDKELFKEYTKRGTYLDFVVWPALFLHKEGPLLSKGIAQGTKE